MRTLKSIGVLSSAKMMGCLHAALGLLVVPLFLFVGIVASTTGKPPAPFAGIGALILGILAPFLYGMMGFIFGALMALLYNVMAKWIGGIQFEIEPAAMSTSGPPLLSSAPRDR
jgi:hypothetical protein